MNINLYIILAILFIHWFCDFVLQTEEQAKNKSSSWNALITHTLCYSLIFTVASIVYAVFISDKPLCNMLWFGFITFVVHTGVDYYTSRVNKQLWEGRKVHEFFVSIGFDQFLHFAQLLITFKLLE